MPYQTADYNVGGKLFLAVLAALLLGYLWACFENNRNPLEVAKLFSSSEPPPPPSPAKPKPSPPPPTPVKPAAAPPAADPVPKPDPAPRVTAPERGALKTMSPAEAAAIFSSIDENLRRGRILEAREKINSTNKLLLPESEIGRFRDYEERVGKYYQLAQETSKGIIDMPQLYQLITRGALGKLVVKILSDKDGTISYETITGIRSTGKRSDFESIRKLEPPYARAEIREELKKQAGYKGIDAILEPGQPSVYRERPGKKATGLQFFDLADFCARNGFNDELVPLFDEALKRDPDLLNTVHETKAERMVNVFFYFLGTKSAKDAEMTLGILNERYADSRAYREKVAGDKETQDMIQHLLKGPVAIAQPVRPTPPAPDPVPRPPAVKERPANPVPQPQPPQPIPPQPPPPQPLPPAPEPAVEPPPGNGIMGTLPAKTREFVAKGDAYFQQGMAHLRRSDLNTNPEGWAEENKKALELFMKANNEGYLPAQNMFGKGPVPRSLCDKVRETTMLASLCRKRSVTARK